MRAIATYQRVSNKEQARDSEAFTRQGWQLDRAAVKYPELDRLKFSDIQSGRRDDRPDFIKLIAAIEAGKIDVLIITRIDRIGRDVESNSRLQKQLQRKGVRVYEILLGRFLDWQNPHDWSYFVQAGLDGEKESRMLSARIAQTFEYHRAQGKMGGGMVGFPYRRGKDGRIEPHPDNWEIAVRAIEIVVSEQGATMGAISKIRELGIDRTRAWLSNWIRSPLLRGHTPIDTYTNNRRRKPLHEFELFRDSHPSLFADPRLVEAEKLIDRIIEDSARYKGKARSRAIYALSGLIYCGRCGEPCHIKRSDHRVYAACRQRTGKGISCGGDNYGVFNGTRKIVNTPYPAIEEQAILALSNKATELIDLEIAKLPTERLEHPDIAKLRDEIKRLESFNDPDLIQPIVQKQNRLNELLLADPTDTISEQMRQGFVDTFSSGGDFWLCSSEIEKRSIYRDWIREIRVNRSEIEVVLVI